MKTLPPLLLGYIAGMAVFKANGDPVLSGLVAGFVAFLVHAVWARRRG